MRHATSGKPRCKPGLSLFRRVDLHEICVVLFTGLLLIGSGIDLSGCGGTAPRFKSGKDRVFPDRKRFGPGEY
jgi:hypothetical protein